MPHQFDRAVLERDLRRRRSRRAARAMAAVDKYLVRRDDGLVLLFTPPFDQTPRDPGYIKGYPPGIRENGGQYTHAAIWSVIAFAMLGDGDKARRAVLDAEPDQSRQHARRAFSATRSSPMSSAPTSIPCRPMSGAADGPGIPARRDGCTAPASNGSSASACRERRCYRSLHTNDMAGLRDVFPIPLQPATTSAVENPRGVSRGIVRAELDGAALPGNQARIPLADDGATHRVRIVLG